jgi:hypothetical protein
MRPRARVSDRAMALDAAARRDFEQRFPQSVRIRNYI